MVLPLTKKWKIGGLDNCDPTIEFCLRLNKLFDTLNQIASSEGMNLETNDFKKRSLQVYATRTTEYWRYRDFTNICSVVSRWNESKNRFLWKKISTRLKKWHGIFSQILINQLITDMNYLSEIKVLIKTSH